MSDDLKYDLKSVGLPADRVRLFEDLNEALDVATSDLSGPVESKPRHGTTAERADIIGSKHLMSILRDELQDALMFRSLGSHVRGFGIEADVYDAVIDIVREIGEPSLTSLHETSSRDLLCAFEALVLADVELNLHPAEATMLDGEGRASVREYGYGAPNASVIVQIEMKVDFEANIASRGHLNSLTVVALEPSL